MLMHQYKTFFPKKKQNKMLHSMQFKLNMFKHKYTLFKLSFLFFAYFHCFLIQTTTVKTASTKAAYLSS